MRKILVFILLLVACAAYPQRVLIKGIAVDTTKSGGWVSVIVNDTIARFKIDTTLSTLTAYHKLVDDTNYVVHTKPGGAFSIKAALSDTLYFTSLEGSVKFAVKDLAKQKSIHLVVPATPCEAYTPCADSFPKHFVFIGEKIKVERSPFIKYCNRWLMDSKFDADYKVFEKIYGESLQDTIHFVAYDHYGWPAFSKYNTVLLFVSEYCGEMIHQKYQYYDLYKTTDNKWAAPYDASGYDMLDSASHLKPEIIPFKEPVIIDIANRSDEQVKRWYPSPYYKIENGKAIAVYGNYVPELLRLKKATVLKARGVILK